jgi:AcrR family transcriptional regulator
MPVTRRSDALRPPKKAAQNAFARDGRGDTAGCCSDFLGARLCGDDDQSYCRPALAYRSSLYEYFPSKDAILVALMEEHLAEAEAILGELWVRIDTCRDRRECEVVRRFAQAMFDVHARNRALHRLLFEEKPVPRQTRQRLAAIEHEVTARVEGYLRARPGMTQRDPALTAAVIVQCIEGLTHKLVVHGEAMPSPSRMSKRWSRWLRRTWPRRRSTKA